VIAGKYQFVYCGDVDVGIGWFEVGADGSFVGGDSGAGIYKGTALEDDAGWITLDLSFTIPPGTTLVQGTSAQDLPHDRSLHAYLPPAFGDGRPQQLRSGPGIITIMVKRARDDFVPPPLGTKLSKLWE
jgi:hypothetical protein